ncbi:hypothetical protein HCA93_15380 [Listeria innocua]|nr:hypothetical protein [Listeria innocua]
MVRNQPMEVLDGSARQKTMKYGKRIIVVTFKRVEGEIRISDAWVKTK